MESCHSAEYVAVMAEAERPYLVCYDYGMGGLWWWISARSATAITDMYRGVTVFEQPPPWWSEEDDRHAARLTLGEVAPGLEKG